MHSHLSIFTSANNDNVYVPGHHSYFNTGSHKGNTVNRKSKRVSHANPQKNTLLIYDIKKKKQKTNVMTPSRIWER